MQYGAEKNCRAIADVLIDFFCKGFNTIGCLKFTEERALNKKEEILVKNDGNFSQFIINEKKYAPLLSFFSPLAKPCDQEDELPNYAMAVS